MQLALFNSISTALKTLSGVGDVDRYNDQFGRANKVSGSGGAKSDEAPIKYPACYIEFGDCDCTELTQGEQLLKQPVTIHYGAKSFLKNDKNPFASIEDVNFLIQGMSLPTLWNRLRRVSITFDPDYNNVQVYKIHYVVSGRDRSARRPRNQVLVNPVTPVVTNDLEISNQTIRTDVPLNP